MSTSAPAFSNRLRAESTAARTAGWIPSTSVSSSTTPTRRPATPSSSRASTGSGSDGIDVESQGSWPHIASSSRAVSATVVANGPAWSRLEA